MRWNRQGIFNSTLQGSHSFFNEKLRLDWKGIFSNATNLTPANATTRFTGLSYDYSNWNFAIGGMYRSKNRNSFFNEYTFDSATGQQQIQVFGQDWNNFDGILITPREFGNVGDPLNYDAYEKISAGYAMAKLSLSGWELIGGLRIENTDQGYALKFPRNVDPEGRQKYTDWLPSLHIKKMLTDRMNLRLG